MTHPTPAEPTAGPWRRAGRALLEKTVAEFCYEELLGPVDEGDGVYRVDLAGGVSYRFEAHRGAYGSWFVTPGSVRRLAGNGEHANRTGDGAGAGAGAGASGGAGDQTPDDGVREGAAPAANAPADDPMRFFVDARETLGLAGETIGHLVRELNATLAADTRLLTAGVLSAAELADLPYEQLEGHQTGHPWIVLNKGRIGFSAADAQVYPPEARRPMTLPWIAVHQDLAQYRAVPGLDEDGLRGQELGEDLRAAFTEVLRGQNLDPARYHWLPVHPWQWDETILPLFAAEVATKRILSLGAGTDTYLAQQSIRTFTNTGSPRRRNVKLPLSVLNTLVWRGLPTERTLAAPAVTAWLQAIAQSDSFLRDDCKVVLLGEVASVSVEHPTLDSLAGVPYQYRELLGAIWREPLSGKLEPWERARTLASLLYVDQDGRPFVAELVERSGLDPRAWLSRLFAAMLPPLLHFLYAYGTVFSPHGENAIVVYDEHDIPIRLAVKDFVDDVNVSAEPLPELASTPPDVANVLLHEAPDYLCQFLHAGLFIGHYRYLAEIAERALGVPGEAFWRMLRSEILAYQASFPQFEKRFALFDLFTPRIDRLCLNRNRLLLDGYRDRATRPHVEAYGTIPNPLAG